MADPTGNNKVTLAILSTKLDTVIDKLDEVYDLQNKDHDRIGTLEGKVNSWRWISTTVTGIAAIISGWVGLQR